MSDQRRKWPAAPDLLPGEEELSSLYQQTDEEQPPAAVDATVLAAAQRAVRARSRRVYFLPPRRWALPLSLAAALVVSIGVTMNLQELKRAAQVPRSLTAPPLPPADEEGRVEFSPKKEQPTAAQESLAPEKARVQASQGAQPAVEAPVSSPPIPAPAERFRASKRSVDKPAEGYRSLPEASSAYDTMSKSNQPEPEHKQTRSAIAAPRQEKVLAPDAWLARIAELRHAGKQAEAEASLKAFKQQYPDYPLDRLHKQ